MESDPSLGPVRPEGTHLWNGYREAPSESQHRPHWAATDICRVVRAVGPLLILHVLIHEGTQMHLTYYLSNLAGTCLWYLDFCSCPFVRRAVEWHSGSQGRRSPRFFPRGIAEQWSLSQDVFLISWQHRITHLPPSNASYSMHIPEKPLHGSGYLKFPHPTAPSLHGRHSRWTLSSRPSPCLLYDQSMPRNETPFNKIMVSASAQTLLSCPSLSPPKKPHWTWLGLYSLLSVHTAHSYFSKHPI